MRDNPAMRKSILLLGGLAFLLALPVAAVAGGVDQFKAFLAEAHNVSGSFTQTVVGRSGRKPQQSSGVFALSRPGKFRWSYEKPYRQLLVSDGERLWSYDPDLNQATVKKLDKAFGASPAALLSGEGLESNFQLKDVGTLEGFEVMEAVPRTADASFERVRIGLKDRLPRIMEVQDNFGQTTTLYLNQFQVNKPLAIDLFRFKPPQGADVVGE